MRNVCRQLIVGSVLGLAFCLLSAPKAFADGCALDTSTSTSVNEGCSAFLGTALYSVIDPHPTGTGFIDSFLRVQMDGTEQGYSTTARVDPGSGTSAGFCNGGACDSKTDPNYTHTLLTSAALIHDANGNTFLSFFLDINEPNGNIQNFLTLDQLEIWTSTDPLLDTHTSAPQGSSGTLGATSPIPGTTTTLFYSLDTGLKDNWINLDYSLINHNGGGSGWGDMQVLIPVNGVTLNPYLYLFSEFGCVANGVVCMDTNPHGNPPMESTVKYTSADGFEEWWVDRRNNGGGGGGGGVGAVPEPGTLFLVASGVALVARRRRRQLK